MFPPAANQLWISDNWASSLGAAPQFAYKLQVVSGESTTDLSYQNVSMTSDQWRSWAAGGTTDTDKAYIITCILTNLGLVAA